MFAILAAPDPKETMILIGAKQGKETTLPFVKRRWFIWWTTIGLLLSVLVFPLAPSVLSQFSGSDQLSTLTQLFLDAVATQLVLCFFALWFASEFHAFRKKSPWRWWISFLFFPAIPYAWITHLRFRSITAQ